MQTNSTPQIKLILVLFMGRSLEVPMLFVMFVLYILELSEVLWNIVFSMGLFIEGYCGVAML